MKDSETAKRIKEIIYRHYYGEDYSEISDAKRSREMSTVRQIAMMITHEIVPNLGSCKLGTIYKKNHATVLYSYKTMSNLIETEKDISDEYASVKRLVKSILSPNTNMSLSRAVDILET